MPKILEDLRKKIMKRGMPKSNSYAIATSVLQKRGLLKKKRKVK